MAVTNGYTTVIDLRDELGDTGNNLPVTQLERAINTTSRAIDKYCGRRFWQDATVKTRTYRPTESDIAWVDDISTTTGLVIKTDTSGDGSWSTTWASDDYELWPDNADMDDAEYAWWKIIAIDDQSFITSSRRKSLQVTAKFGWSGIPDEIERACLLKAVSLFKRKDAPFGVAGFGEFGAVRITRKDPDVIELLSNHIKYVSD